MISCEMEVQKSSGNQVCLLYAMPTLTYFFARGPSLVPTDRVDFSKAGARAAFAFSITQAFSLLEN